ncbi:MAG: class II aldolase/adducin family protein [Lautropia sp.]
MQNPTQTPSLHSTASHDLPPAAAAALDARRPPAMPAAEWRARIELAACYRLFDHLGWAEMIFNHLTLRVPGGEPDNPHYLINPFGLHYTEVTASNLVKIDLRGKVIGSSEWPVNPAGFVIHSAVHGARADAHCVMHTHTTAGMAVACKREGLRHDNFYSAMLANRIAYHVFEGVTTGADECERLVASLGACDVMILRNHGLLVTGPDVAATFRTLWTLQRACEVQLASDSMRGENLPIDAKVLERIPAQREPMAVGRHPGQMMFDAILRRAGIRREDLV